MNYLHSMMGMYGNNTFVGVANSGMLSNPHAQIAALGILLLLLVWSFIWKGIALWQSARNHQYAWFIILLVVNTVGILEIVYLLFFRKHKNIFGISSTTNPAHASASSAPSTDPGPVVPPSGPVV